MSAVRAHAAMPRRRHGFLICDWFRIHIELQKMSSKSNENSATEKNKTSKRKAEEDWKGWGDYMSKKQEKLWHQFERGKEFETKKSDIFRGVCIFVNGYTDPPSAELRRLMQQHGGEHHLYETSRTTHVIASNLCYSKMEQAKATKTVKPQWITDCIKEGRLLPEKDYLLIKQSGNSTMLKFLNTKPIDVESGERHQREAYCGEGRPQSAEGRSCGPLNARDKESDETSTAVEDDPFDGEQPSVSSKPSDESVHRRTTENVPTATDPNFVKDYYSRSRLHYISTWAQEMKSFVSELKAAASSETLTGIQEIKNHLANRQNPILTDSASSAPLTGHEESENGGVFMHLDLDCFFVSVGLRKRVDLRGKPVAVAHSTGERRTVTAGGSASDNIEFSSKSEIASCSYEARARGVRNGMMLGEAKKLCSNIKTIPYDFKEYHQVSQEFYKIVCSFTLQIEPVSCDEAYLDISSLCNDLGATPLQVASVIRAKIHDQCQCPSSAGIGPNMLVARLATRRAKPNGQYQVSVEEVEDFMAGQKLGDIPGIGHEGRRKLQSLGVDTCQQLWSLPISALRSQFGSKTADQLFNFSKGIDTRRLKTDHVRKSVSCDMNYGIRFVKKEEVHRFLTDFTNELVNRLKTHKVKGRMIILKLLVRSPDAPIEPAKFLGCGMCDAVSRSTTLAVGTDEAGIISKECIALFQQIAPVVSDLRGIGISIQKLQSTQSDASLSSANTILRYTKPMTEANSGNGAKDETHNLDSLVTTTCTQRKSGSDDLAPCVSRDTTRNTSPLPTTNSPVSPASKPAGRRTLFDECPCEKVKALIEEWVSDNEEPYPPDVAMLSDYFVGLIAKLELQRVCNFLAVLNKAVSKSRSDCWSRAYEAIVDDIQTCMHSRYGCPLRLSIS